MWSSAVVNSLALLWQSWYYCHPPFIWCILSPMSKPCHRIKWTLFHYLALLYKCRHSTRIPRMWARLSYLVWARTGPQQLCHLWWRFEGPHLTRRCQLRKWRVGLSGRVKGCIGIGPRGNTKPQAVRRAWILEHPYNFWQELWIPYKTYSWMYPPTFSRYIKLPTLLWSSQTWLHSIAHV